MDKSFKVVFVVKQTEERQASLKETYSKVDFSFFPSMVEAEQELSAAHVLVTFGEDIDEEIVNKAAQLKWIHVLSAGVEKMPLDLLEKKGVVVTNSRGIHAIPMSEHALWAMLDYVKNTRMYMSAQNRGEWIRNVKPRELTESVVVLLGTGAIASKTAERAKNLGMHTVGVNTDGRAVTHFDTVYPLSEWSNALRQADFLINILPFTKATDQLLNKEAFSLLKEGAVFINLGRGKSVVEKDLLDAVKLKRISHAYLDVFASEPLPTDSPLWAEEGVTITPHISASTSYYMKRALQIFGENLIVFIEEQQKFKNLVQMNKGY
ncbi:D-2-hydroxyacid dehydrogenase [Bacillus sp. JCM 19041]|uniref:D-2-hydroxyacid dehydrogenase n=1 Tax=Bacillus sp. JCM 19041 TaxID=1460637 RepID=UPI0006D0E9FC